MELIFFWICTIIASKGMDLITVIKILKDIGSAGYKLNAEKIKEFTSDLLPDDYKIRSLISFIPFLNIIQSIMLVKNYLDNQELILDQFDIIGALEEMTEEEKREFDDNPTGLTTATISMRNESNEHIKKLEEKIKELEDELDPKNTEDVDLQEENYEETVTDNKSLDEKGKSRVRKK